MTYSIEMTRQAIDDLKSIFEYIAVELQSPQAASTQFSRLENRIMALDNLPERYRLYDKEPWKSRGLRIMPVDNYCVFYITDNHSQTVSIIRIMYAGRDYETLFQEMSE